MCVKLAMEGSCSPLCNNICFRYQLVRNDIARSSYSTSFPIVKRMYHNNLTNDDKATVQFAKELIFSRDYIYVKNIYHFCWTIFYVINMYNFAV